MIPRGTGVNTDSREIATQSLQDGKRKNLKYLSTYRGLMKRGKGTLYMGT